MLLLGNWLKIVVSLSMIQFHLCIKKKQQKTSGPNFSTFRQLIPEKLHK